MSKHRRQSDLVELIKKLAPALLAGRAGAFDNATSAALLRLEDASPGSTHLSAECGSSSTRYGAMLAMRAIHANSNLPLRVCRHFSTAISFRSFIDNTSERQSDISLCSLSLSYLKDKLSLQKS